MAHFPSCKPDFRIAVEVTHVDRQAAITHFELIVGELREAVYEQRSQVGATWEPPPAAGSYRIYAGPSHFSKEERLDRLERFVDGICDPHQRVRMETK